MKEMSKTINIAVVGLGQVGCYLLNELNTKKKDIEINLVYGEMIFNNFRILRNIFHIF